MAIVVSERPGVYTDYSLSAVLGGGSVKSVGLVSTSAGGEKGQVQAVTRETEAVSFFGADTDSTHMVEMVRVLLQNGVSKIYAVGVGSAPLETDYAEGFTALCGVENIGAVVCDSEEDAVHRLLRDSAVSASANRRERIAFAGKTSSRIEESISAAGNLNSERFVLAVQPAGTANKTGARYLAAAMAALCVAGNGVTASLNGMQVKGIASTGPFLAENEISELIRGGITPFEQVGGRTEVIRAVTTKTTTDGVADRTLQDLSVVLTIDDVLTTVRDALKARLSGARNNSATRTSIATQAGVELRAKQSAGIIESYAQPRVTADPEDTSVCRCEIEFAVARGINQIHISANITV